MRNDGSFRILHLTDIQDTMYPNKDTLKLIDALLVKTKPDLVILTGDQLKGYSLYFKLFKEKGIQNAIFRLMSCMEKRHIPYAVTFGNHDMQCGMDNEKQEKIYQKLPYCHCVNAGTFSINIKQQDETVFRLYVLDSGYQMQNGKYLPPEKKNLYWLDKSLREYKEIPSFVFQHIPLPEYRKCIGVTVHEPICSAIENEEFQILKKYGNVLGVFCGHDHKNDFLAKYEGIDLAYTPSCGFASYGNGVLRGGRLLVLDAKSKSYTTKIYRYKDVVAIHTKNRLKEYVDSHVPTCWPVQKEG